MHWHWQWSCARCVKKWIETNWTIEFLYLFQFRWSFRYVSILLFVPFGSCVCNLRIIWNHHSVCEQQTKYMYIGDWCIVKEKDVKQILDEVACEMIDESMWSIGWLTSSCLLLKKLEARKANGFTQQLIKKSNRNNKNHNQIDAFRIRSEMNRNVILFYGFMARYRFHLSKSIALIAIFYYFFHYS